MPIDPDDDPLIFARPDHDEQDVCPDHGCRWTSAPWPSSRPYCPKCAATWSADAIAKARAAMRVEETSDDE